MDHILTIPEVIILIINHSLKIFDLKRYRGITLAQGVEVAKGLFSSFKPNEIGGAVFRTVPSCRPDPTVLAQSRRRLLSFVTIDPQAIQISLDPNELFKEVSTEIGDNFGIMLFSADRNIDPANFVWRYAQGLMNWGLLSIQQRSCLAMELVAAAPNTDISMVIGSSELTRFKNFSIKQDDASTPFVRNFAAALAALVDNRSLYDIEAFSWLPGGVPVNGTVPMSVAWNELKDYYPILPKDSAAIVHADKEWSVLTPRQKKFSSWSGFDLTAMTTCRPGPNLIETSTLGERRIKILHFDASNMEGALSFCRCEDKCCVLLGDIYGASENINSEAIFGLHTSIEDRSDIRMKVEKMLSGEMQICALVPIGKFDDPEIGAHLFFGGAALLHWKAVKRSEEI